MARAVCAVNTKVTVAITTSANTTAVTALISDTMTCLCVCVTHRITVNMLKVNFQPENCQAQIKSHLYSRCQLKWTISGSVLFLDSFRLTCSRPVRRQLTIKQHHMWVKGKCQKLWPCSGTQIFYCPCEAKIHCCWLHR